MKIDLGFDDYLLSKNQEVPVSLDFNNLLNAHMLVMGKTGVGKTTFLRSLINKIQLATPNTRIHIMDVHGDIEPTGACSVRFSESTEFGLNPFIVSSDPHFGGVRKRIEDFIYTVNASQPIGSRQEAVMRHLIADLYAANGFYSDNYKSWVINDGISRKYPKKYPTIDDACRYANAKLKHLIIGGNTKSGQALDELNKVTNKLLRLSKQQINSDIKCQDEETLEKIMSLRLDAKKHYNEYIETLETGRELDDFIRYESKDLLKSIVHRFENMKGSGVFKNSPPPFNNNCPVWHYNITALREHEKRLFVEFRLQEIFSAVLEKGPLPSGKNQLLREILVIDEAHLFFRDRNIFDTIAKEGRKFGLGLICASQSPTHFSEDFFSNVATKVLLGVDQMYWDNLVRKMKIDQKLIQYIRPFHVIGVQVSNKAETRSLYRLVKLADERLC